MNDPDILCIVAGGSGGHILPALLLGKKWLRDHPNGKIIFFCGGKQLDKTVTSYYSNYINKIIHINLINIPGFKFWLYPKFLFQLFVTFTKSFFYLLKFRPHKIITTGGYISVPVCLVGKYFKSEIDIHELNVVPGKAIKFLISLASKVVITFDVSKIFFKNKFANCAHKCELQDYPIRFERSDLELKKDLALQRVNDKFSNDLKTDFTADKKTVFLLGGSQGSSFLNDIFKQWIIKNQNLIPNLQVIHQTGLKDKKNCVDFYSKLGCSAIVFSYYDEIKDFYLISDFVISRAGAGTLFELEFFKKKSLIIPLKTFYTDHQVDNALQMSQRNPDLFFVQDQDLINKDITLFEKEIIKYL